MPVENTVNILGRLQNDPCLAFLGRAFTCINDEFTDPKRIVDAHGELPVEDRQYTLIEIRYTWQGFVGNFLELSPRERDQGFHLRRFKTVSGPHPHWYLVSELSKQVTRAKFATDDYRPTGIEEVSYAKIRRSTDGLPVSIFNFDPMLLKYPARIDC